MLPTPTQPPPKTAENQPISPTPASSAHPLTSPPAHSPSHLLTAYRKAHFNPIAFAEQQNLAAEELIDFIKSPAVQDHLATVRAFAEESFALHALQARSAAISTLLELATKSADPIEKRRAASAILRGLNTTLPGSTRSANAPGGTHLRGVPAPGAPAVGGTDLRGVHSDSSPSQATREPATHPAGRVTPNHGSPVTLPLPAPTVTPSPTATDESVAHIALLALRNPKDRHRIATLRAFCMPTACFGGTHIPTDDDAFARRAIDLFLNHDAPSVLNATLARYGPPTENAAAFEVTIRNLTVTRNFILTLTRESTRDPWLIESISSPSRFRPP